MFFLYIDIIWNIIPLSGLGRCRLRKYFDHFGFLQNNLLNRRHCLADYFFIRWNDRPMAEKAAVISRFVLLVSSVKSIIAAIPVTKTESEMATTASMISSLRETLILPF